VSTFAIIFPNVPPASWGCGGDPYVAGFTASETGYDGEFTAVSTDTDAATVTSSSTSAFTVTDVWPYPSGSPGPHFDITVSDTLGNSTYLTGDFNAECLP